MAKPTPNCNRWNQLKALTFAAQRLVASVSLGRPDQRVKRISRLNLRVRSLFTKNFLFPLCQPL
jgi:hypothetical protein